MTHKEQRYLDGRRLLARLESGTLQPIFIEGASVGYLILALLERIQKLEEDQQHGQGQE